METCQSGLTYLFAKEAGALKPLDGSNPSVSAGFLTKLKIGFERNFDVLLPNKTKISGSRKNEATATF